MIMPYCEPGGKDFAKQLVLKWFGQTGGSNIKLLELATGLPVNILEALLEELNIEGSITYKKCYRGVKIWRVR